MQTTTQTRQDDTMTRNEQLPANAVRLDGDWVRVREGDRIIVRRVPAETDSVCAACAGTGVLALGLVAVGGVLAGRAAIRRLRE
jgi:hypothetical protein